MKECLAHKTVTRRKPELAGQVAHAFCTSHSGSDHNVDTDCNHTSLVADSYDFKFPLNASIA